MSTAWRQLGTPVAGGILLIGDHASNHVPPDIDLGIPAHLLNEHVAIDLGVAEVAERLVASGAVDAAILGGVSRLVVDYNREEDAPGLIAEVSDGHFIPGNQPDPAMRSERLTQYYRPYHAHIAATLAATRPAFILSLHSFTPRLTARPDEQRPWQIGILYNQDDRLARQAIALLADEGVAVGDQLPYSGRLLNHTMNRHAEANAIPYLGIELRQDEVADAAGQDEWADRIGRICSKVTLKPQA